MPDKRTQIGNALDKVVSRKRGFEFQCIAVHLAKNRWPDLAATEWFKDGGEDAITIPSACSDGINRSLACSITGTLKKLRDDCRRIFDRKVSIGCLVFCTPGAISNTKINDWRKKVKSEFNHDLFVIPREEIIIELERPANAFISKEYLELDFEDEPTISDIVSRAKEGTQEDLVGWKSVYGYNAADHIELTIRSTSTAKQYGVELSSVKEIWRKLAVDRFIILQGVPGAGKTITLLQVADYLVNETPFIPIFISLSHFARIRQNVLSYLEDRSCFRARRIAANELATLNSSGRLVFLLNGWNEISSDHLQEAEEALRALVSSSPHSYIFLTTRTGSSLRHFSKTQTLQIEPLSFDQRRQVFEETNQRLTEETIRRIEQNTTLDRVTRTPLFLYGVIQIANQGEELPKSRYGIIGRLVEDAEKEHETALIESSCAGFQREYLAQLAHYMTECGGISVNKHEALEIIGQCNQILLDKRLIGTIPNANLILLSLCNHHLLTEYQRDEIQFSHQQFQEWFAANWVFQREVEAVNSHDPSQIFLFQETYINQPVWEETLLLLIEFLSGKEIHHEYAITLVNWTIPIDLAFAARLTSRSNQTIWSNVGEELSAALRNCFNSSEPHREYALLGMVSTGKPDFYDLIFPLLEDSVREDKIGLFDLLQPLPLSCLEGSWRAQFDSWDEEERSFFLRNMSWGASHDQIELAIELATEDSSSAVRVAAMEILVHTNAFSPIVSALEAQSAHDWPIEICSEVIPHLPQKYIERLALQLRELLPRLGPSRAGCNTVLVLHKIHDPIVIDVMKEWIQERESKRALVTFASFLIESSPEWMHSYLIDRLSKGELWEEKWIDLLRDASDERKCELANSVFEMEYSNQYTRRRFEQLSRLAPDLIVDRLIEQYFELNRPDLYKTGSEDEKDKVSCLRQSINYLPFEAKVSAILRLEPKLDYHHISTIAELLAPFNSLQEDIRSELSIDQIDNLRNLIKTWEKEGISSSDDDGHIRSRMAYLLGAIGKPEDIELIRKWIEEDNERVIQHKGNAKRKYEEWLASGSQGSQPSSILHSHTNVFANALILLDCDQSCTLFLELLENPEWVGCASQGLIEYLEKEEVIDPDELVPSLHLSGIFEPKIPHFTSDIGRISKYAQAIRQELQRMLDRQDQEEGYHIPVHECSSAISALSLIDGDECIPLIFRLAPVEYCEYGILGSLGHIAAKGITFPGEEVERSVEPMVRRLMEDARASGEDGAHFLFQYIYILLQSDTPSLGIEAIRRMPSELLDSYSMRDFIPSLGNCRSPEISTLLAELMDREWILKNCTSGLITALRSSTHHGALPVFMKLLEKVYDIGSTSTHDMEKLAEALGEMIQSSPDVWEEIAERCKNASGDKDRIILVRVLEKVGTEEAALIVCEPDWLMNSALLPHIRLLIENAVHEKVQTNRGGSYYIVSRNAGLLRGRLFDLAMSDSSVKSICFELLAFIEITRHEWGRPSDESRHPKIIFVQETDNPWLLS